MKTMPEEFTRAGFHHRLVTRRGLWAVFERKHADVSVSHFECVKLHTSRQHEAFGEVFEAAEIYPAPETWGTHGWTYPTLEAAMAKLDAMSPSTT